MQVLLWLLPAVFFAASRGQSSNYCGISPEHTLCKFSGVGGKCTDLSARGVDDSFKQEILQVHNTLRAKVAAGQETRGADGPQPSASNMQVLTWDEELANIAQRWADQCTFQHDCSDCRRVGRFFVGQNLYTESSTNAKRAPAWKAAINAWYDEVSEFSSTAVDKFKFSAATGHYTQVVWAKTNKIGCGFTTYRSGAFTSSLYVCNYGPAGNTIFAEMYKRGPACSACPSGSTCSKDFPSLCVSSGNGGDEVTNVIPSGEKLPGTKPVPGLGSSPGSSSGSGSGGSGSEFGSGSGSRPESGSGFGSGSRPEFGSGGSEFGFRPDSGSGSEFGSGSGSRPEFGSGGSSFGSGSRPEFGSGGSGFGFRPDSGSGSSFGSRPDFRNNSTFRGSTPGKDFFKCNIGRTPCRGSFAGSPWRFSTGNSKDSRNKRQGSDFIESTVSAKRSTEFRLDRELPAPESDRMCLTVSLKRKLLETSPELLSRATVPPLIVYVQPKDSKQALISLNNLTPDDQDSGWLEARVTLRGVKTPFRMGFRQAGLELPNELSSRQFPAAIQLALNKIGISDGSCNN